MDCEVGILQPTSTEVIRDFLSGFGPEAQIKLLFTFLVHLLSLSPPGASAAGGRAGARRWPWRPGAEADGCGDLGLRGGEVDVTMSMAEFSTDWLIWHFIPCSRRKSCVGLERPVLK